MNSTNRPWTRRTEPQKRQLFPISICWIVATLLLKSDQTRSDAFVLDWRRLFGHYKTWKSNWEFINRISSLELIHYSSFPLLQDAFRDLSCHCCSSQLRAWASVSGQSLPGRSVRGYRPKPLRPRPSPPLRFYLFAQTTFHLHLLHDDDHLHYHIDHHFDLQYFNYEHNWLFTSSSSWCHRNGRGWVLVPSNQRSRHCLRVSLRIC